MALDLLVLWRGTPGWFTRGSGSGGASTRGTSTTLKLGGLNLRLGFDRQARTARIQGKEVALRDANVILVDRVDGAEGPQVVGTVSVDPQFPESAMQLEAVLRRSPELVSFLRCDAPLPDPRMQRILDGTCAHLTGK